MYTVVFLLILLNITNASLYHYDDKVPIKIRFQHGETITEWFELNPETLPSFKRRSMSVVQPQAYLSVTKYTQLRAMISFSQQDFESEWFMIQDGIGSYIKHLEVNVKLENNDIQSISVHPIYPFLPPNELPDIFLLKFNWLSTYNLYTNIGLYVIYILFFIFFCIMLYFIFYPPLINVPYEDKEAGMIPRTESNTQNKINRLKVD
ncbi:hypothetical protein WA158_005285 [Blastocystis sp. Blastoise]